MDTEVTKSVDLTGQVIGSYHITGRLGRGGMADVYKALHTELKVHRAIKFIRPEFVTSEDFRARFQKEAQAVAKLEHPNIVRIHDFGNADNQFYMVMQFVEGLDLKHELEARNIIESDEAIDLVVAVAAALSYAHDRDLIHRDIKPENIMLGEKGEPILMDFGIAKLLTESTALTQTGVGIGTPAYMAPEQAQGQTITPATDIYALAVVLYELVTGSKPYSADTPIAVMLKAISDPLPLPRDINPAISEELQAVILKGTAKNPLQRYQTAEEFADDLRRVRQGSLPPIATSSPVAATAGATTVAAVPNQVAGQTSDPTTTSKTAVVANKVARGLTWLGALTVVAALAAGWWWWNKSSSTDAPSAVDAQEALEPAASSTPVSSTPTIAETNTDSIARTDTATPSGNKIEAQAPAPAKSIPANVVTTNSALAGEKVGEIFAYRDTLAKGQTVEGMIDLTAGDELYLRVHSASAYTDFAVLAPGSDKPLFSSYNDEGPVKVKQTGAHLLSGVVRQGKEAEIDMQLFRINPANLDGGKISFGDYHSAAIKWPGQRFNYTAELAADDVVYLEVIRADNYVDFSLRSMDDRKDLLKSYNNEGPVKVPVGGTHQFYADPRNHTMGNYEFILHKLSPAIIDGGTYQANAYAEASTSQPGQVVSYTVDLKAGDYVFFDVSKSTNYVDFTLVEPGGRKSVFKDYGDAGPFELTRSGAYKLTADPRGAILANYEFRLHKLAPGIIDGGAVTHNEVVSGKTTQPGQIAHYSLTLTEPARVGLQRVDNEKGYIDFTLRSADDRSKVFTGYGDVAAKPLGPGTYRFIVDPRAKGVGSYEFMLQVQPNP